MAEPMGTNTGYHSEKVSIRLLKVGKSKSSDL